MLCYVTSDPRQVNFDCDGGDLELVSITDENSIYLQGIMGTAMTVTICPRTCFDSCGCVYATAVTVPHFCSSGTVILFHLPVPCNGCVRPQNASVCMRPLCPAFARLHATILRMTCPFKPG